MVKVKKGTAIKPIEYKKLKGLLDLGFGVAEIVTKKLSVRSVGCLHMIKSSKDFKDYQRIKEEKYKRSTLYKKYHPTKLVSGEVKKISNGELVPAVKDLTNVMRETQKTLAEIHNRIMEAGSFRIKLN